MRDIPTRTASIKNSILKKGKKEEKTSASIIAELECPEGREYLQFGGLTGLALESTV